MEEKKLPNWLKILKYFDEKSYIQNGLTIPFLIGANSLNPSNGQIISIREFLLETKNNSNPLPLKMMKCGNIGEYVIGELDSYTNEIRKQKRNMYLEFDNFLIEEDVIFDNSKDFVQIIETLEGLYVDKIKAKTFSKNEGEWSEFSLEEISRIMEVS